MKKILSALVCALIVLTCAVGASAASKDDILAAAKAAVAADVYAEYEATMINTLNQLTITAAQADAIIARINQAKAEVTVDSDAWADYTAKEKEAIMDAINDIAETLDIKVEVSVKPNDPDERQVTFVSSDNKVISRMETDPVKKTGFAIDGNVLMALAAVLLAAVAVVAVKKSSAVLSK